MVTYLESKVQRYAGSNALGNSQNFAGEQLTFMPNWNYSFNADYRLKLADGGTPFVGATVIGRSGTNTAIGGGSITIPLSVNGARILRGLVHPFTTDPYATVDARIGYEAPGGRWRANLYGKNIFNKYYWNNVVKSSDASARSRAGRRPMA